MDDDGLGSRRDGVGRGRRIEGGAERKRDGERMSLAVEARRDEESRNGRWYEGAGAGRPRWRSDDIAGGQGDEQGSKPRAVSRDSLVPKEDGGDGVDGLTWRVLGDDTGEGQRQSPEL
jgi:hypothetical protein